MFFMREVLKKMFLYCEHRKNVHNYTPDAKKRRSTRVNRGCIVFRKLYTQLYTQK